MSCARNFTSTYDDEFYEVNGLQIKKFILKFIPVDKISEVKSKSNSWSKSRLFHAFLTVWIILLGQGGQYFLHIAIKLDRYECRKGTK